MRWKKPSTNGSSACRWIVTELFNVEGDQSCDVIVMSALRRTSDSGVSIYKQINVRGQEVPTCTCTILPLITNWIHVSNLKKKRKWNVINSFELALQYYSQNRKSVLLLYGLPSEFYDNNNIRYIICMIVLRRKCHGFDESAHSTKTYMTILVIHCIFTYIGKIEI